MSKVIIKVSRDEKLISNLLNCTVGQKYSLHSLMHHKSHISSNDLVLLVLGGDHSRPEIESLKYSNGLKAIAKVVKSPYNLVDNHYSLDLEIVLVFNNTITKDNLYIYPELKDIPNIGASTKGVKNQAVSIIDNQKFENSLKAIIDFDSTYRTDILQIVGGFTNNQILKYPSAESITI